MSRPSLLASAVALAVYASTLSQSIPGGDSGELVAEGCILGHAHPPGYPTITMLYHAATSLLASSPTSDFLPKEFTDMQFAAKRANSLSAMFGAVAAFCVAEVSSKLCKKNGKYASPSFVAASGVLYACSPLVWQYSVGAEVFALNNAFAAAITLLTVNYFQTADFGYVDLGAFVCGLALTNQHTVILFEIPFIASILFDIRARKKLTYVLLARWAALFVAGLLPYAYLPATGMIKGMQAGSWSSSTSFAAFFHHLRRGDYGTFQLYSGNDADSGGCVVRTAAYVYDFISRQGVYGVVPALSFVGFWHSEKGRAPLLIALLFYLFVFHSLSNLPLQDELLYGVHQRFWMQPNAIAFAFFGPGAAAVHRYVAAKGKVATALCVLLLGWCVPFIQIVSNYETMDQTSNVYFEQYARALLEPLPPRSVLLTNYDQQWTSLRYVQKCMGIRDDITVINLSMMTFTWFDGFRGEYPLQFPGTHLVAHSGARRNGGFSFVDFLNANSDQVQIGVYVGGKLPFGDKEYELAYSTQSIGLLKRFLPKHSLLSPSQWVAESNRVWKLIDGTMILPPIGKYNAETWEWTLGIDYHSNLADCAAEMLQFGIDLGSLQLIAQAAMKLERCFSFNPEHMRTGALQNLGLAYVRMVQLKKEWDEDTQGQIMTPGVGIVPGGSVGWKSRAARRAYEAWGEFLKRKDATKDPSYVVVKETMITLSKVASKKT